jgi:hypothetical protein
MSSFRSGSTPSDRSIKNTVPSGGFAADCFFDGTDLQTEVLRKIRSRIASFVSLVDGGDRYAGAGDHWPAERNCRIHDHDTGIGRGRCLRLSVAGERIKLCWKTLRVPLYPLEVNSNDLLHSLLSLPGSVDQLAVAFDEKIQPVRLERCVLSGASRHGDDEWRLEHAPPQG